MRTGTEITIHTIIKHELGVAGVPDTGEEAIDAVAGLLFPQGKIRTGKIPQDTIDNTTRAVMTALFGNSSAPNDISPEYGSRTGTLLQLNNHQARDVSQTVRQMLEGVTDLAKERSIKEIIMDELKAIDMPVDENYPEILRIIEDFLRRSGIQKMEDISEMTVQGPVALEVRNEIKKAIEALHKESEKSA